MGKYDDDAIQSLSEVESVRFRPTVYVKELGQYGLMHMVKEIIANSIDEFLIGHGDVVEVSILPNHDKYGDRFIVNDYGRGIPHGKVIEAVSKLHASGKYGDIAGKGGTGYDGGVGGTHGLGSSIVNFLSRNFEVITRRDGYMTTLKYDKGILISNEKVKYSGPSGTTVSYTPDQDIVGEGNPISVIPMESQYYRYIEILSYINPGLTIKYTWGSNKPVIFYHKNGTIDYFKKIVKDRKMKLLAPIHHIEYHDKEFGYNIVFGFMSKGGGSTISYINSIPTVEGGNHVIALYEAMGVITTYMNRNKFIPKSASNKYRITGNEIRDSLFAIIIADKLHAKFDTQVKSKFSSPEYRPLAVPRMKEDIIKWVNKNKPHMDKIGAHLALMAKARYETQVNKDKILKSGTNRQELFKNISMKKFADCNKNDPSKTELFLCEGDSAATGAKSGRDRDYQAVFALRGKVKNTIKSNVLSDELKTLVKIMGCGINETKDISKLRYNKIIILTDADVDGYHISALLVAFFFKYYPELIEAGKILMAKPPLYTITIKGEDNIYINNDRELNNLLIARSLSMFSAIGIDGKKLPKGVTKHYIQHLPDYSNMIDEFAISLAIDPLLLEGIIMNLNDILKGKFDNLKHYGFTVSKFTSNNICKEYEFNRGYEHYSLKIDKRFIDDIAKPIIKFITEKIRLCRVRLKGNATGYIYSGFYYEQGKLIYNSLFNAKDFSIHRDKGLGSMDYVDLRETSMDMKTRYVITLDINDKPNADEWVTNLFTNSEPKKKMFMVS